MSDYGYQANIATVGAAVPLIASDFEDVLWKPGGITIDWDQITAVGADTPLENGIVIPAGYKYIPTGEILAKITASGKYRIHRTNSADGSQTLERGYCWLVNVHITQLPLPPAIIQSGASDHPGVFNGGTIWRARLKIGGANQATLAQFVAAFPMINFADM